MLPKKRVVDCHAPNMHFRPEPHSNASCEAKSCCGESCSHNFLSHSLPHRSYCASQSKLFVFADVGCFPRIPHRHLHWPWQAFPLHCLSSPLCFAEFIGLGRHFLWIASPPRCVFAEFVVVAVELLLCRPSSPSHFLCIVLVSPSHLLLCLCVFGSELKISVPRPIFAYVLHVSHIMAPIHPERHESNDVRLMCSFSVLTSLAKQFLLGCALALGPSVSQFA